MVDDIKHLAKAELMFKKGEIEDKTFCANEEAETNKVVAYSA